MSDASTSVPSSVDSRCSRRVSSPGVSWWTVAALQLPTPRPPTYIAQGQLMARIFQGMAEERLQGRQRKVPLRAEQLQALLGTARANITISGQNGPVTRQLAQTMFPNDPAPVVTEEDLGSLIPAPAKKP